MKFEVVKTWQFFEDSKFCGDHLDYMSPMMRPNTRTVIEWSKRNSKTLGRKNWIAMGHQSDRAYSQKSKNILANKLQRDA